MTLSVQTEQLWCCFYCTAAFSDSVNNHVPHKKLQPCPLVPKRTENKNNSLIPGSRLRQMITLGSLKVELRTTRPNEYWAAEIISATLRLNVIDEDNTWYVKCLCWIFSRLQNTDINIKYIFCLVFSNRNKKFKMCKWWAVAVQEANNGFALSASSH